MVALGRAREQVVAGTAVQHRIAAFAAIKRVVARAREYRACGWRVEGVVVLAADEELEIDEGVAAIAAGGRTVGNIDEDG